jgi:hypothetical protein
MNTARLKRFAPEARLKLIQQVGARLDQVLGSDTAALREKAEAVKQLREAIKDSGRDQVIDRVAYTWFNRLMALRFMDANDYQPIGLRVVSPKDGYTLPELLDEAKQGNIPEGFVVDSKRVYDLLDGRIPSPNGQNEAYKELLIAACNHLHTLFPFLFERLSDYSELLLPDDLTSEFSIVHDVCAGMTKEDCAEVEIIGWLYQFYIAERKDEVFAAEGKVSKEDIPAATQLFTPRWIVEYMVQNTVGKLWLQNRPNSRLREHMPYFIDSPSLHATDFLKVKGPEDLTLLDSACGSGHILVYGFELFTKIYEEEGYTPADIPKLIIEHNLFGFEIDERAAQLAGFALLMKARGYHRRFLRAPVKPNILCYRDVVFTTTELAKTLALTKLGASEELKHDLQLMANATNFGSLIIPHTEPKLLEQGLAQVKELLPKADLFERDLLERLELALEQLQPLARKYHCIVDNPPYMGGRNMNTDLSEFVKINYPAGKTDLMACFMEAGIYQLLPKGYLGMINQHSWMFLSSYEELREELIKETYIDTLLHLGPRTFPEISGEIVQNAAFTVLNTNPTTISQGVYIRLLDYDQPDQKRVRALEAIRNSSCGWVFNAKQSVFQEIPGKPLAYWLNNKWRSLFKKDTVETVCQLKQGIATGDNDRFLRYWFETSNSSFLKNDISNRWYVYRKGGQFRRWYGNNEYVVNWSDDGNEVKNNYGIGGKLRSRPQNLNYQFRECLSWSLKGTKGLAMRWCEPGQMFDINGMSLFVDFNHYSYQSLVAAMNSKLVDRLIDIINPTLSSQAGDIAKLPFLLSDEDSDEIYSVGKSAIEVSMQDWNSSELNWGFKKNELTRIGGKDIEEACESYKSFWRIKFLQLHKLEEANNLHFIRLCSLQEELTPEVPLEDVTILQNDELDRSELGRMNRALVRIAETGLVSNYDNIDLPFNLYSVIQQFLSYTIGCIFGRYSLDKEGLISINPSESLDDHLAKVGKKAGDVTFLPDADNIIPVLDDEWFEDDVVGRFHAFLKATFGTANFEKNLAFVEEYLGKDIRKYFTKDFYTDHVQRYSKRPIYWMFSSPKGAFSVLVYMHRYTPDTLNRILNNYLRPYKEKLKTRMEHLDHQIETGSASEHNRAAKEKDKLRKVLLEVEEYERDVLYPLATERIAIDLDDGVLVNYNKFGKAIKEVAGLNDKKAKDKVKKFDWIDTTTIR